MECPQPRLLHQAMLPNSVPVKPTAGPSPGPGSPSPNPTQEGPECWQSREARQHIQGKYSDSYRGPPDAIRELSSAQVQSVPAARREHLAGRRYCMAAAFPVTADHTAHKGLLNSQEANPQPLALQAEPAQRHLTELCPSQEQATLPRYR